MEREIFKQLGFTEGEISVYLALIDLGESSVGPISKKSGVTHAKTYPILDKLIVKGLVSHVIKEGRKYFSATSPENILEFIESRIDLLKDKKQKIKESLPELKERQKSREQIQYSRTFEGFKGLRALFRELFLNNKEKKEIYVFGLNEILKRDNFINFFLFYHELRLKNNIRLKLILNRNMKDFFNKYYKPTGNYKKPDKVKFIDLTLPIGVFIFKDHVINIIADEKVTAFDIKSKQCAERYKDFFEEIWKTS